MKQDFVNSIIMAQKSFENLLLIAIDLMTRQPSYRVIFIIFSSGSWSWKIFRLLTIQQLETKVRNSEKLSEKLKMVAKDFITYSSKVYIA